MGSETPGLWIGKRDMIEREKKGGSSFSYFVRGSVQYRDSVVCTATAYQCAYMQRERERESNVYALKQRWQATS